MAEQRIYLDKDNKLVIETDNGRQDVNGTTTKGQQENKRADIYGSSKNKNIGVWVKW